MTSFLLVNYRDPKKNNNNINFAKPVVDIQPHVGKLGVLVGKLGLQSN